MPSGRDSCRAYSFKLANPRSILFSRLTTACAVLCLSACAGDPPQEYPPADTSRWAALSADYNSSDLRIVSVDGTTTTGGLSHGRRFLCSDYRSCKLSDAEQHSLEVHFTWDHRERKSSEPGIGEQILFGHCLVLFVICFPVLALAGEAMDAHNTKSGIIGECRASLQFTPAALRRYAIQIITSEAEAPKVNIFDLETGEDLVAAVCQ